jgi:hypothetical protein
MSDNRDAFAFGGNHQENGDARVLALFHDWLDASRESDRHSHDSGDDDEAKFNAAIDRREETETEIISIPGGATASAIKAYLYLKNELSNWAQEDATLRFPELFDGDENGWAENIVVSILRDAAKQVPELAELAAPILHEDAPLLDADIEIRWCLDRLADRGALTEPEPHRSEIREQLAKALDRVAKTEAKTPRGDEIKRRHAPIGEPEKAELLARAEALVAEYGAPLPDGDAGLIEAERRLHELEPRRIALRDALESKITPEIEAEIIDPVFNAMCALDRLIATTPATTLAGAAVKLRRLLHPEFGIEIGTGENDLPCLHHILSVIEREAGVATSPEVAAPAGWAKALNPDPLAATVSEALALRLLSRYHDARDAVEHYGGDVSALPVAPSFAAIDERYTELMRDEVVDVRPETTAAELRYLDLVEAIIVDRLSPHDAPVMSDEGDLSCALQMLQWVRIRANSRDLAEGIAEWRSRLGKRP